MKKLRLEARPGDSIFAKIISRLDCNVDDLRLIVQEFKDKNITVHFIKEGFSSGNGNIMFKFILTIIGTVTEKECESR